MNRLFLHLILVVSISKYFCCTRIFRSIPEASVKENSSRTFDNKFCSWFSILNKNEEQNCNTDCTSSIKYSGLNITLKTHQKIFIRNLDSKTSLSSYENTTIYQCEQISDNKWFLTVRYEYLICGLVALLISLCILHFVLFCIWPVKPKNTSNTLNLQNENQNAVITNEPENQTAMQEPTAPIDKEEIYGMYAKVDKHQNFTTEGIYANTEKPDEEIYANTEQPEELYETVFTKK